MKQLFFILLFSICSKILFAQIDPHFSQYYAYPMWLNPGMTGVMDGDYRVTSVYRNQWSSVLVPYSTVGLSADVATGKNINIGINAMSQSVGDAGYKYITSSLNIAYSGVRLGIEKNHQLTAGLQFGILSRRFDPSKFQFGDQWNAVTGYDPSVISTDILTRTSSAVFDIGAGLSYFDNSPNKKIQLFGGVGVFHLNLPYDRFIDAASYKDFIPARITGNIGGKINLNETVNITPHFLYMQQGKSKELMAGLFSSYEVNDDTELYLGANYRLNDAISPYFGVGFRHIVAGFSYDVTTSDLGKAVPGTGGFEVSISYTHPKSGKSLRYLSCPKF